MIISSSMILGYPNHGMHINLLKISSALPMPQPPQSPSCTSIKYIDCRNWFDFSTELLSLLASTLLILHVAKHYRNLKKQKQQHSQSEHQRSVRRKIRVNLIQLIYLACFALNTIFDCFLFVMYRNEQDRKTIQDNGIDRVYKLSQVFYVNWLNTLNLTVGFLYWKATRAYYVLSELDVPLLYRRSVKVLFFIFFCFNASAIIIAFIFLIVLDYRPAEYINSSIFTLISTTISIIACIGSRTLYSKYILTKVELSPKALRKQKLISVLLLLSSLLRILLYSLDTAINDWTAEIRNQQEDENGGCIDEWAYYAFVLLVVNFGINLLPAAIYGHLFVSEVDMKLKGSREKRLIRNDSQYS